MTWPPLHPLSIPSPPPLNSFEQTFIDFIFKVTVPWEITKKIDLKINKKKTIV